MRASKHRLPLIVPLVALLGCGGGGEPVELRFAAVVGAQPFACGETYEGLGPDAVSLTPIDLRLFVYDLRLVDANGAEVPATIDDDGRWQNGELALLSFGTCGDAAQLEANTTLRASAPPGDYVGVRFRVGVPESLNHLEASRQAAPMNLTAMWWSWNAGYKYIRLDGRSGALEGWRFHLGAAGCEGDMRGRATCAHGNRVEVSLDAFDLARDEVVLDLAALVAGSSLASSGGAPGCMSSPDDADCAPLFDALGLPFAGGSAGTQRVFGRR